MLDVNDMMNDAETFITAWLTADTEVTANKIHEKLAEEWRNYSQSELPAIAVHCSDIIPEDGIYTLQGVCEIITAGDLATADLDCKKTISQIVNSFNKNFVPGVSKFETFQDLEPGASHMDPMKLEEHGFFCIGYVEFILTVIR